MGARARHEITHSSSPPPFSVLAPAMYRRPSLLGAAALVSLAAAAAQEGIELLRESTEATAARNKRMIEEYVRAQLNNKQEDTL